MSVVEFVDLISHQPYNCAFIRHFSLILSLRLTQFFRLYFIFQAKSNPINAESLVQTMSGFHLDYLYLQHSSNLVHLTNLLRLNLCGYLHFSRTFSDMVLHFGTEFFDIINL